MSQELSDPDEWFHLNPWRIAAFQSGRGFGRDMNDPNSQVEDYVHLQFVLQGLEKPALFIATPAETLQMAEAMIDSARKILEHGMDDPEDRDDG